MPDISQIRLNTGTIYDIKDAVARANLTGVMVWIGVTTTALTDGSTTNPITIGGNSVTATTGNVAQYGSAEFVWSGSAWQEIGDLSVLTNLGSLAWQSSASGTFTPAGTVSQPSFTGTQGSVSVSGTPSGSVTISKASSGTATFTPSGTVSTPTITVTPSTTTVNSITAVGSLPSLSLTVSNEVLTINWSAGTLPTKGSNTTVATGISSATSTQPTFSGDGIRLTGSFSGDAMTSSGNFTPAGTVSQPTFSGTAGTVSVS